MLRGLAFIAVVYQHVIGQFIQKPDIHYYEAVVLGAVFNLLKFAVPLFVFITGLTLFYHYFEKMDYGSFIKKRMKDIYLPFTVWTIIYYIYTYHEYLHLANRTWLKNIAVELIAPTYGYHLWYIVMVFQFYLLYPILLSGFKRFSKKLSVPNLMGILAVFYGLLMWASQKYLPAHMADYPSWLQTFLKYRTSNFMFYLFYFFLGGLAALHLNPWRRWVHSSGFWNLCLFIGLYIWVTYELFNGSPRGGPLNLGYSTSLKLSMFLFTVSHILCLYKLALQSTERKSFLSFMFGFIGKYSFGGYLMHALVLGLTLKWLVTEKFNSSYVITSLVVMAIVCLFSILLTFLLSHIPWARYLVGTVPLKRVGKPAEQHSSKAI